MSFFNELKRRNVFRVGIAYALISWVLLQAADFAFDLIGAPNWVIQALFLLFILGLPGVLIFAWVFEMTPDGIKREKKIDPNQSLTPQTGRKLDRAIIVLLTLAVALLLVERFVNFPGAGEADPNVVTAQSPQSVVPETATYKVETSARQSVAVLPFVAMSNGPDDGYFADGLTEEILNSLAQLPELLVTARTSAFTFKDQDVPVQEIAARLGVANIVEGSVRRSGDRLRVTAQLIRASDGFHLWSNNYDSSSTDTIAVQEDIAEKIASAMNVVLDDQKREAMRLAGLRNVEAFVAMQKGVERWDFAHNGDDIVKKLAEANRYFDQVLEMVPDYALAYQYHSDFYIHQLIDGANGLSDGVTDPAGVKEAMTAALADYEQVLRHARTSQERNNAELDLAYITGEWHGMPARIEQFAAARGCSQPNWIENVALPFGYSHLTELRAREFTVCDPMSSSTWRSDVRTLIWNEDPAAAIESGKKGLDLAPGDWLRFQLVSGLVALKRFEEADSEISARFQDEMISLSGRMMIAAARGDGEQVDLLFEQFGQNPDANDFWELNYAAWAGDRARANAVAARIDGHAFGSQALTTVLIWCLCGPAFDLEATPNFAANIRHSGLVWPPVSPVEFPLKNW